MPYYGVPVDQSSENVAFSFNKDMITGLLREKYRYNGVVCTDWGLITDAKMETSCGLPAHGAWKISAKKSVWRRLLMPA